MTDPGQRFEDGIDTWLNDPQWEPGGFSSRHIDEIVDMAGPVDPSDIAFKLFDVTVNRVDVLLPQAYTFLVVTLESSKDLDLAAPEAFDAEYLRGQPPALYVSKRSPESGWFPHDLYRRMYPDGYWPVHRNVLSYYQTCRMSDDSEDVFQRDVFILRTPTGRAQGDTPIF